MGGCTAQVRWFVLDFPAATPLRVAPSMLDAYLEEAPATTLAQSCCVAPYRSWRVQVHTAFPHTRGR